MPARRNVHARPRLPSLQDVHSSLVQSACGVMLLPLSLGLSAALRRILRKRPDVFDRMDLSQHRTVCIAPTDMPVSFQISLGGLDPHVRAIACRAPRPSDARIEAPIRTLINVFEGREDGDAVFFSNDLWIEGDTSLIVGLRNALEEAELTLADLLPLGLPILSARQAGPDGPSRQGAR